MSAFETSQDQTALAGGALTRDRSRELLGQVMGLRRRHGRVQLRSAPTSAAI